MYIPRKILIDSELHPNSILILYEIISLSQTHLGCIAENYYFSKLRGVGISTVQRYLQQLKDKGYIDIEFVTRENRRGQIRVINPTPLILEEMATYKKRIKKKSQERDMDIDGSDWFDEYWNNR